jgi:predicted lipoprotein with Yx(FWY)xxD motif
MSLDEPVAAVAPPPMRTTQAGSQETTAMVAVIIASIAMVAALVSVGFAARAVNEANKKVHQAAGAASAGQTSSPSAAPSGGPSSPGTMFSTADVSGLGTILVDGRGHTVYVLTADGKTNVPCEDSTGCTRIWPDLPFPAGTSAATAGTGVRASLLGSKKLSDGETYPTYNGWLMYEYVADTGPARGLGEGITSFGGTWYALDPSGNSVVPRGASSTATTGGG